MTKRTRRPSRPRLLALGLALLLAGCATGPDLVGTWGEIGQTARLELRKDGTFKAKDNQGMEVSGKYARLENSRLRFEILHPGSSPEIVVVTVSLKGDELTIVSEPKGEVEKYRRLKKGGSE